MELLKLLDVGGYTGTGIRPNFTQAKKEHIDSRPGGKANIILSPSPKS
jgi:hypothetical protein